MSERFQMVSDFYTHGLWSAERVRNAVGRWITQDECDQILGT